MTQNMLHTKNLLTKSFAKILILSVMTVIYGTGPVSAASEEVLNKIEADMVNQICADNGEWLRCYGKDPAQCKSYAKAIVRPCVEGQIGGVRGPISLAAGLQYAVEMKGCFNAAVPQTLGEPIKTKECTEMRPMHLW